ncbi:hypothetical protein [Methanobrevibacter sp.]|uniref:hypothetical protein n=1 Tax=Methanobrevibacter sp. TaxID=66852 RepID=UPI003890B212
MILNPVERYMKEKGKKEGIEEGIKEGKLEIASNLLDEGFIIGDVVRLTGLSEEDILNAG